MSTAPGGDRDDGLDVERAWADIVSRWKDDPARPESPPHGGTGATSPDAPPGAARHPRPEPVAPDQPPGTGGTMSEGTVPEGDDFTPADPPGWSSLVSGWSVLVWALVAGPAVLLLVLGLAGHVFGPVELVLMGVCFVTGMVLLIARLRGRDSPPPPDDGAVV